MKKSRKIHNIYKYRDSLMSLILLKNTKFILFFLTSLTGLMIDLSVFYICTFFEILSPYYSNVLSSSLAVLTVYTLSTKIVFKTNYSFSKFIRFLLFYLISILIFSFVIKNIVLIFQIYPFFAKLIVVPFSFLLNYVGSKKVLG
jgi:putative flippase GtrA